MARPLKKQAIDKGQVWTTFIGGAVVLFLGTLAIENNSAFFPAIARANKASADMRKATEVHRTQSPCAMHHALGAFPMHYKDQLHNSCWCSCSSSGFVLYNKLSAPSGITGHRDA